MNDYKWLVDSKGTVTINHVAVADEDELNLIFCSGHIYDGEYLHENNSVETDDTGTYIVITSDDEGELSSPAHPYPYDSRTVAETFAKKQAERFTGVEYLVFKLVTSAIVEPVEAELIFH